MADEATKHSATCERFPNLQIGADIKFNDGVFTTTDPALWARLQQHEWWDVLIKEGAPAAAAPVHEPDPAGETSTEEPKGEESSSRFGGVHRGGRGSR
jgi:hypothetical protein